MYTDKVMEHFNHPKNVGVLENANGIGEVGNAKCGDIMQIFLDIQDDIIQDVSFKTFGCGAAVATSSITTELVKGKTIKEALSLTNGEVAGSLDGLPPAKIHCSVLAEGALKAAIADYYTKKGVDPSTMMDCTASCAHDEHSCDHE